MTTPLYGISGKRIWVAGHRGMVGSAVVRRLESENCEVLTVGRDRVDLRRQAEAEEWMAEARPDAVIMAAATVGGILANSTRPAEFIYDNLAIETNIIHGAYRVGVEKLLFLGSSCIYPRNAPQPMKEEYLLTGPLEPTNQWYAIAKIAGIKMCQAYREQYGCDFISAQPTNLYGPGDNFDLNTGHVIPALIRKAHEAKVSGAAEMVIWGTGKAKREFLYVDDLADALVFLLRNYSNQLQVNVGTGEDVSVSELAELVCQAVRVTPKIRFEPTKPDGAPEKVLDCQLLKSQGWKSKTGLRTGLEALYEWYTTAGHGGVVRGRACRPQI